MQTPPRISEAEWDVMRVLWDRGRATSREVVEAVAPEKGWNHRTVRTLIARLVKKGVLGYEAEGKRYVYHPLVSRDECALAESRSLVERVFGGSVSQLFATFVRGGALSPEELAELRRLLDEQEQR
jgi:BlaI family penicillinase repressor